MSDARTSRAAMREVRGLMDGEVISSWHGGVVRGRAGGFFLDIYAWTNQRRRYRLGVDVNGDLYLSDGRVVRKSSLSRERRPGDIENDLRVYANRGALA